METEDFMDFGDLVDESSAKPMKMKKEKKEKRKNMKKDEKKDYALKLIEKLDNPESTVDEKLQNIIASELGKKLIKRRTNLSGAAFLKFFARIYLLNSYRIDLKHQ